MVSPSIPPPVLPVGRHIVTIKEFHDSFVRPGPRDELFNQWLVTVNVLRQLVTSVPCAWIGGSYVGAKPDPDDIDCLFFFVPRAGLSDDQKQILAAVGSGPQWKRVTGLKVDSYLLVWPQDPTPGMKMSDDYSTFRGWWDDFWMRMRSGSKGDPPRHEDCLPRRGYLEVTIDGWT